MDDRKILKVIDDDGKEFEYEVLMVFTWNVTGKNYLVYTDNTFDDGSLNIFASIYDKNLSNPLVAIESEEEWEEIENRLEILKKVNK